jgi:hypothetical protein
MSRFRDVQALFSGTQSRIQIEAMASSRSVVTWESLEESDVWNGQDRPPSRVFYLYRKLLLELKLNYCN